MPREIALPKELVEKMIDLFTTTCFLLERARGIFPGETDKTEELVECVKDADYAVHREFGYYIRDIFVKREKTDI